MSADRDDRCCVKLLYWEHQIPVLAPDDVAVFQLERAELARVKNFYVRTLNCLFHHEEPYPFGNDILAILADECLCSLFVFARQRLFSCFLANSNVNLLAVHHYQFKHALTAVVQHMNVDRLQRYCFLLNCASIFVQKVLYRFNIFIKNVLFVLKTGTESVFLRSALCPKVPHARKS